MVISEEMITQGIGLGERIDPPRLRKTAQSRILGDIPDD
jgi:hypothetical protein